MNAVVHGKCDRCHQQSKLKANTPVCKMADNGWLTVDQKVKVVLFYEETKGGVATQRRFRALFGARLALCKRTIYRLCQQFETNVQLAWLIVHNMFLWLSPKMAL